MKLFYCLFFITLLFIHSLALAQDSDKKAQQIFQQVDQRRSSIKYEQSEMQMRIYNSRGAKRERTIKSYSINEKDEKKSLLIFESPANIRGTAFLTKSKGSKDLQKLYLPALKRIQTISSAQKSDRFMGSDFTYEDLGNQNPDDYLFTMKAETDTAYVLRAIKKGESQYNHILFFIDPQKYALLQVQYYNSNNKMIKKLAVKDLKKVNDELWLPKKMTMFNLQNNTKTLLIWNNRKTGKSIPQWRFTERGLRRGL